MSGKAVPLSAVHSTVWRYGVAISVVMLALGVRLALEPVVGRYSPYLPCALAIMVVARFAGRMSALTATLLSALGTAYFFLEPRYSLAVADPAAMAGLMLFVIVGVFISLFVGQLRAAQMVSARAEEALRMQAQLIDLSHDAVITADANRVITSWNIGATNMYGWTPRQALGKTIDEVLRIRNTKSTDEIEWIIDHDGRWDGELIHTGRDGRQVISDCRLVVMRDAKGVPIGRLEINRDITQRRRAEEELVEAHQQNTAILESISDGFIVFDREWRYVYVNPAAARMVGKTPQELLGKNVWELWPHAANSPFGLAYLRAVAENVPVQVEAYYPEPLNAWFEVRCYPSPEGLTLFFTDTTERRHADERLSQKQKLESIGLLAGGIAHDFNNLLTVIMGSADMALAECHSCEYARSIRSAAERASYLTKQLLAYAGKGKFVVKVMDLSEVVARSTELLRASLPKRVRLDFDFGRDLPCLETDPGQMEQILMNLVINAGEAIPSKTDGLITVATRSCEVTQDMARSRRAGYDITPGVYVCLEVRDNGMGMDDATVARIFDPFFSTKFTGRGLGLAAVHGIVRSHQGFVDVRTAAGAGTTFQVFLPASAKKLSADLPHSTERQVPDRTSRGSASVLVVDDEEMVRKLACLALRQHGYEVVEAENGQDALEVLAEAPALPSVVFLDLAMPVMGGDELVPILETKYPGLKIVVSSGYPEEEARKGFQSGFVVGFLQKPYTGKMLADKIAEALEDTQGLGQLGRAIEPEVVVRQ